jgi:D-alanyl-D-alanine carboxypeptidase/D-alanyl-D-alanine-endopeptidase (penicillin-binding protein 4)
VRRPLLSLLVALAVLLGGAAAAQALSPAALHTRLAKLQSGLGPLAGAQVIDLATGDELYAHAPDLALAPASNEKLFVTAAALLRFGADGTLTTSVRAAPGAEVDEDGRLGGDLYLVGGGDPTLDDAGLRVLVTRLQAAGLRRIDGGVRGDDSFFDALRGGPDSNYGPDRDLGGLLTALSWRHGSSASGGPPAAAARRFATMLKAAGITYGRRPRAGRMPRIGSGGAAAATPPLATYASPDMRSLVAAVNVESENFYAEMLAKALGATFGATGSTAAGLAVARAELAELDVAPRLVDGSGLSRRDQATPRQLVRLLSAMDAHVLGDAWERSLPVLGVSGTLRRRMRGTPAAGRCAAKTGTLIGVSALSGVCTTTGGRRVAFSFLENRVNSAGAKRIEDKMVAAIARLD